MQANDETTNLFICFAPIQCYFDRINYFLLPYNIAHQFMKIFLLLIEYEAVTCCTICQSINAKFDKLKMFID